MTSTYTHTLYLSTFCTTYTQVLIKLSFIVVKLFLQTSQQLTLITLLYKLEWKIQTELVKLLPSYYYFLRKDDTITRYSLLQVKNSWCQYFDNPLYNITYKIVTYLNYAMIDWLIFWSLLLTDWWLIIQWLLYICTCNIIFHKLKILEGYRMLTNTLFHNKLYCGYDR